jgi:hypothetical protein
MLIIQGRCDENQTNDHAAYNDSWMDEQRAAGSDCMFF